jgi:hypothetical protein
MCLCGMGVIVSRADIVYRDPDLRSCRVYGLSSGFFFAHTYGCAAPPGLSSGWDAMRGPDSAWTLIGWIEYKPVADSRAYYRSDWNVTIPLWTPFVLGAIVLSPRLPQRLGQHIERQRRRRAISPRRVRRRAIAQGCCPGCRYSIVGLPENDGRRTCPECGDPLVSRADR